jgi:RING finger protein 121
MSLLIIGVLFGSQLGILWWKQNYYSSFRNLTLLGLWLFPIIVAITGPFYKFIFLWLAFTLATMFIISKAMKSPLEPIVPRLVYKWFLRIHQLCSNSALIGYILVVCDYFLTISGVTSHVISSIGLYLVFYGVYFGVIGRDLAELCSERMATVIGFTGKKDEIPTRGINERLCGICNGPLASIRETEANSFHDEIYTLSCDHRFHEGCIRGWIIVGKKETCPYCSEKVTYKTSLLKNPWETQSIMWGRILDAVRYLVVWNPLILIFLNFLITKLDPAAVAQAAQNTTL